MTHLEMRHVFVDVPAGARDRSLRFWSGVTGWPPERWLPGHPEFDSLTPSRGTAYLHVQQVDAPAGVHLDFEAHDIDAEAESLVALGARRGERHRGWRVMASPGGLPFCVAGAPGGDPRNVPAARWPDGHRSRVAQVCLDVPAAVYDAELAFWHRATGWRLAASAHHPEFHRLSPPRWLPFRLLVQRLGPTDAGHQVRAHLDVGTDDVDAEVRRVVALGARETARHGTWVVLADPTGIAFCVTRVPPGPG